MRRIDLAGFQLGDIAFRHTLLLSILVENGRPVLCSAVRLLPIKLYRVMRYGKINLQQLAARRSLRRYPVAFN